MVLPPKQFWGSRILAPFPGQCPLKRSSRAGFQALVLDDIAFCYKKRDLGDPGEVWVNGDVPGVELSIAPRNSGTRNQPHILADEMPRFVSAVHQLGDSLCRWSLRSSTTRRLSLEFLLFPTCSLALKILLPENWNGCYCRDSSAVTSTCNYHVTHERKLGCER